MKTRFLASVATVALLLGTTNVLAQEAEDEDEDGMEATMRLMDNAEVELPDAVTKEIHLPDSLLEKNPDTPAIDNSAKGQQTADENRSRREEGQANAEEAREHGAEMSEQAQENRENHGRAKDRPEPPNGPPGKN